MTEVARGFATGIRGKSYRLLHRLGGQERGRRWFTRIEEDELRQRRRRNKADGAAAPKPGEETLGGGPHHAICGRT